MDRLADLIIRYPKFIILVFCFITLIMVFGLTRLETHNNYEGDLPASDPIVQTIARFEEVFGNEQLMMVAVESPNLFSIKTLNKIARLSEALSTV